MIHPSTPPSVPASNFDPDRRHTNGLPQLPPLESGDRLTRLEFERRYTADPRIKKAELIEGVVYVASPLRFTQHAQVWNSHPGPGRVKATTSEEIPELPVQLHLGAI